MASLNLFGQPVMVQPEKAKKDLQAKLDALKDRLETRTQPSRPNMTRVTFDEWPKFAEARQIQRVHVYFEAGEMFVVKL